MSILTLLFPSLCLLQMATNNHWSTITRLIVFCGILVSPLFAQSNYASQANNVEYNGDGLPEEATLDGKVKTVLVLKG